MSKIWFITGAGRGLGEKIARAAIASGDCVIATARKADSVAKALEDTNAGDRLLPLALDVTDTGQPEKAVAEAMAKFKRIDVLVNNAGYGQLGFFETLTPEQIDAQYATNVFGLFNVTRAVLPVMRRQRSGHILNMSSIGGVFGFGEAPAYTSTKFAVEGFSEDMAIDLKPFGIHVTLVEPGFFRTDFLDGSSAKYGAIEIGDYAEADAKLREKYSEASHKQLGDPEKLADALVRIVAEPEPPLRLALGSDAVKMTRDTLTRRLAELDRWQTLSETTDHNDAADKD
jgi:NAD(P)-dependent dehydrogenase (short-subunit alcohol dehydrogenase family)